MTENGNGGGGGFALGLLMGVAAGVAIGMLYAPMLGTDARRGRAMHYDRAYSATYLNRVI